MSSRCLLLIHNRQEAALNTPLFSICIPQYNRTRCLILALESFRAQKFRDFEICISDDRSTDGLADELKVWLAASELHYSYCLQPENLRYDGNTRAALGLAKGKYCLLMGNDDGLKDADSLQRIADDLQRTNWPEIALVNYEDWQSGDIIRRVTVNDFQCSGVDAALKNFRHFAFVSGLLVHRERVQALATNRWDGSEMYQMFTLCKILAHGGRALWIDRSEIRKDVRAAGEQIDSYAAKPRLSPCPIIVRESTLSKLAPLVWDAVHDAPSMTSVSASAIAMTIMRQLYSYTLPYWLVEYRKVQSFNYALGLGLALSPNRIARAMPLSAWKRAELWTRYSAMLVGGLLVPQRLFTAIKPFVHRLAKRATR
jgi:glycosyltransferase involved in cell wall biosynthesis